MYDFKFMDFRLLSVHFDIKTDKEYKLAKDVAIQTALSLRHDYIAEHNTLRLFMKVELTGDKVPFSLTVEGGGLFNFINPVEDMAHLNQIASINCASITFPFVREIVADIIRRSGLPPFLMEPVNFVEVYRTNFPEVAPK